jgi:Bacteroidetes-specific putative membrane protein
MKYWGIVIIALFGFNVQAQNHTMFWDSKSLFNPAVSGVNNKIYAALTGRAQWLGIEGAPLYGNAILDMKADVLHGGVGLNCNFERSGLFFKTKSANVNYSYQIDLKNHRILSLGVSGGLGIVKVNSPSFYPPDPTIIVASKTSLFLNYKFGISYLTDHCELGLSLTQTKSNGNITPYFFSKYLGFCSYRFDIGEDIDIKPNFLIRTNELNVKNIALSSGLLMIYKERFWTGISYSLHQSYGAMIGYDILGMLKVGYSLDFTSPFDRNFRYRYANHEIIVAFTLK